MTDLRQAAHQALEALEIYKGFIDDAHIIEGQWHWLDGSDNAITTLRTALAQPEQGPVAKLFGTLPVYDTPPAAQPEQVDCPRCGHVCSQREWVGLTDDEILEAAQIDAPDTWLFATAYAIEAKLKERNT
jgi:hypothetical protein